MKPLIEIINKHKSKIGKTLLGLSVGTIIYAGALGLLPRVYGEERENNDLITNSSSIIMDDIGHSIQTNKAVFYDLGENVEMTYKITNLGNEDANFFFPTGQQYDFLVEKKIEPSMQFPQLKITEPVCPAEDVYSKIWRWSDDKFFIQTITTFVLSPNESKEFNVIWPQIDDKGEKIKLDDISSTGTYKISGILPTFESDIPISKYITITK